MGSIFSTLLRPSSNGSEEALAFDLSTAPTNTQNIMEPMAAILESARKYQNCGDPIRRAISDPTIENEEHAWNAVQPSVQRIKEFYRFSVLLENTLPEILDVLCHDDARRDLEKHQDLARVLAHILDFAFEFDQIKMNTPGMQNDFSYYRRMLSRGRPGRDQNDIRTAMQEDEEANRVSMYIAYPTPMLRSLINVTTTFVEKNRLAKGILDFLACLAEACYQTIIKRKFPGAVEFYCRVLIVIIILYDQSSPGGAYCKQSEMDTKNLLKAIPAHSPREASMLMSVLRYNSRHLNDESTPKTIKTLVASYA
ncbi:uncharacterized protein VTP21DRAFT_7226 [Calcarisporiella thermophila]|uniref:uncharacterized protein n=1 Tax=Calcarisporiella thermophila TaxID=911321 RepID=UPI0037428021